MTDGRDSGCSPELIAGVGLNAKHDVAVALLGILVGIALTRPVRWHLRSPWLWLGGLVALVLWLPNLLWQAAHGWPVFALSADIADEYGGLGGTVAVRAAHPGHVQPADDRGVARRPPRPLPA